MKFKNSYCLDSAPLQLSTSSSPTQVPFFAMTGNGLRKRQRQKPKLVSSTSPSPAPCRNEPQSSITRTVTFYSDDESVTNVLDTTVEEDGPEHVEDDTEEDDVGAGGGDANQSIGLSLDVDDDEMTVDEKNDESTLLPENSSPHDLTNGAAEIPAPPASYFEQVVDALQPPADPLAHVVRSDPSPDPSYVYTISDDPCILAYYIGHVGNVDVYKVAIVEAGMDEF